MFDVAVPHSVRCLSLLQKNIQYILFHSVTVTAPPASPLMEKHTRKVDFM